MLYTSQIHVKKSLLKRFSAPLFWSVTAHAALFLAIGASIFNTPSSTPSHTLSITLQHFTAQTSIASSSPQKSIAKKIIPENIPPQKNTSIVTQASALTPSANIEAISQPDVLLATTTNYESAKTNVTTNTMSAVETAMTASSDIEKPIFDAAFLKNPQPSYPVFAKKRQQQGIVMLKVKVSIDGKAEVVELAESSGFSLLDDAAQKAVAKWQFIPARRGDVVIAASVIVPIHFALR